MIKQLTLGTLTLLTMAGSLPSEAGIDLFRQAVNPAHNAAGARDRCPTAVERFVNAKGEAVSLNFSRDGVFLVKPDGSQTKAPDGRYVGGDGKVVEVVNGMHGSGGGGGAGKVVTDPKGQTPAGKN